MSPEMEPGWVIFPLGNFVDCAHFGVVWAGVQCSRGTSSMVGCIFLWATDNLGGSHWDQSENTWSVVVVTAVWIVGKPK